MNRTLVLVVSAATLALVALVAGRGPTAPNVAVAPVAPPVALAVATGSSGALTLSAALSSTHVVAGPSEVYAKLDLAAAGAGETMRVPVNLAVALDRSGSMGGSKMDQAIRATLSLIDQLQSGDRLAIVAFDDTSEVYASSEVNSYSKESMRSFVRGLTARGSTNIGRALQDGYAQISRYTSQYRVSRVLLISDGQPTVGITTGSGLLQLAAQARVGNVSTSAFGIGLDFNVGLMRDLASGGGGTTAFIEDAANLGGIFASELRGASQLLARDVKVTITPAPGVSIVGVPGYPFTRSGNAVEVSFYDFGPLQTGQLLVRLAVNAPAEGVVSLGEAAVSFVDVQRDVRATATAGLRASVGSRDQVTAGANPVVTEMATRVDLSARVNEAQAAYSRGDTKSAFDIMANARRLFGTSADALAGSEDEIEGNWRRGGDYARRADMNLTKKTMRNFGQNNAY